MNPPLQIYLIRHGETAWSLTGQHTGHTDLPLTAHGKAMARGLAPVLAEIAFSRVLTSSRLRARATCALAGLAAAAQVDADLDEWDYGKYEGLRTVQVRQSRPHWNVWEDGCPDGEQPGDVSARADRLITRLQAHSGPLALFSHGQFGRALAARWIGLPVAQGQHLAMAAASIGILGHDPGHPNRRVVSLWNATPGLGLGAELPPQRAAAPTPRPDSRA
jgi:broad specificity phosphatase PhoE